jgi:hypothetical protein
MATVSLTVNKATPPITWPTPTAITYGTALSAGQLDATSTVAGTSFVYSPISGSVLTAGSQTLSVTFTPTDTTDYTTATATVQLMVNKATPAITWATPAPINYGVALSATQLDASATVSGTFAYTPGLGTVPTTGTQTLSVTFSPTDTTDYTTATTSVSLVVNSATTPVATLSSANLSFGGVEVGLTSATQFVTLSNTGIAAMSITSITVTGTNASSFVFSNNCGTSLAVGANCTIHGHFAPVTPGPLTAAISIVDNAIGSPQSISLSGTGDTAPAVSLSATSLSFGLQPVNTTSATQSVTLTNTGGSTLSITSFSVTGTYASSFVFSNACGTSVAAGASCTIHGHFSPTAAGAATATVTITDNASGSPQSIALTGVGGTTISLSSDAAAFSTEEIGATSASKQITMTNTGTVPLTISSIAVTGPNASSFIFANNCGTGLAVGASCIIHGHFTPTVAGNLTGSVTITDNAGGSPQSIALTGTGVGAGSTTITLSSASVSLGTQEVGTTSPSQDVTLTNTGTTTLSIVGFSLGGTNATSFDFASTCGTTVAPGSSCLIHGHFKPVVAGALTATVTITDSAIGSPHTIALSGTGVALDSTTVSFSPPSLTFASQALGTTSASQTVTLTNTGTTALAITAVKVTGADASSFAFSSSCGPGIAAGASCTIHGHFAPTAAGTLTAAISVTDSATGSPQSIPLTGTGH